MAEKTDEAKERDTGVMDVDRIASFSDAVFAVAITLLILNIDVPSIPKSMAEKDLGPAVRALWPSFMIFILSFVIIGFFWIFHHRLFRFVEKHDTVFIWLNMFFLMCIVFMPFASDMIGEYGGTEIGTIIYAASWAVTSAVMAVLWWYAAHFRSLVSPDFPLEAANHNIVAFLGTSSVFGISIVIALVNVSAAQYFWIALAPLQFGLGLYYSKRGA